MANEYTVRKIVEEWLREHGYDGLYDDVGGCSCILGELLPYPWCPPTCRPGHFEAQEDER